MSVSELHTVQPPYNLFERQSIATFCLTWRKNLSAFAYGLSAGVLTAQCSRIQVHRRRSPPLRSEIQPPRFAHI